MSKKDVAAIYQLSPAQQGMLFESLSAPENGLYIEQSVCPASGPLNLSALRQAWRKVVDRHSVLRTAFVWRERDEPLQVVLRQVNAPVAYEDWRAFSPEEQAERKTLFLNADRNQGFQTNTPPLLRLTLLRLAENYHELIWTHHHILMDGWCLTTILQDFAAFYGAACRGEEICPSSPAPYRTYINWLKEQDETQARLYWERTLKGFTRPSLPGEPMVKPINGQASHDELEFHLSREETAALTNLVRERRLTLNVLTQGIWALLLSRYNDSDDVVFGNTLSGRSAELAGIETMVGLFMNTLPLRIQLPNNLSFWEWLRQIQKNNLELQQYEYSSAALARAGSDLPHSQPLYETILVFENYPQVAQSLPVAGLTLDVAQARFMGARTRYALALMVNPEPRFSFKAIYDCRRLGMTDVEQILAHAQLLLRSILANPNVDLAALRALLPADETPTCYLPAPRGAGQRHDLVAPRTAVEALVASIWRQVLDLEEVSLDDNFFELGGHSLLATELMTRLGEAFHTALPLRYLFDVPTIAGLAAAISEQSDAPATHNAVQLPLIRPKPADRHLNFPLNEVQQAYWIGRSDLVELGNVACHGYMEFDCPNLDLARLVAVWRRLIERHDMLRAIILSNGEQCILPSAPTYEVAVTDVRGQDETAVETAIQTIRQEMSHQVLPADEWPLFDIRAVWLADNHYRMHVSVDMLIADAHSFQILLQELTLLYNDPDTDLPPLELSFRDYVLAEQALQTSPVYNRALDYWQGRLAALPAGPELPLACSPETIKQPRFQRRSGRLAADMWQSLKKRAARSGLTPSGVLLAAFAEVLATWSKNPHFIINLTLFNRLPLHPQVNAILGDFTSLTLLEVNHNGELPFIGRAQQLQKQLWQDLDHRYVSGIRVQRELTRLHGGASRATMPVVFTSTLVQGKQNDSAFPDWLGEMAYGIGQTPQVWLDHVVSEEAGALIYNWDAVEALFPAGMLDDMFAAFTGLIQALAGDEAVWRQTALDLTPAHQLRQRQAINATQAPIPTGLLHEPFIRQAAQRPDQIAVITPERSLTYAELYRHANQIGRYLRQAGARSNQLVAVVMEKGWQQVTAALGILQAGAAYLPIDAHLPQERIWYLLQHGEVEFALTQNRFCDGLEWPDNVRRFAVDEFDWGAVDAAPLEPAQTADDLAYVIYTSGSTGLPKGVAIDHRAALNTIVDLNGRFNVNANDRVLALSSLSFDLSVYDIFGLLAVGGAVVIPDAADRREPGHWAELLRDHGVTIWNTVPALMGILVEHISSRSERLPDGLRLVMMSGDWIPVTLPDQIKSLASPGIELFSLGGATEASIWSILYPIQEVDLTWPSIPYGKPTVNQTFHVLNHNLRPCPVWTPGYLYIGGVGLAREYWRDPVKTGASFIVHPETGERLYRTGDLGRYLPDGNIEFLGREDFQVKVQGHRIELGEIETALLQHPLVRATAVTAVGERHSHKRLVGYVVTEPGYELRNGDLRDFLKRRLPDYMTPAVLVQLDALPLTSNGKVNRQALPAPEQIGEIMTSANYVAPRNAAERTLTDICAHLLNLSQIGVHDNFFELGGNSVQATQLISALRETFQVEMPIRAIFESPTVAELAERIEALRWAVARDQRSAQVAEGDRIEGVL